MRNVISLDGVWNFGFAEKLPLEEVTAGAIPVTTVMTVPGCYEGLKKYFGRWGVGSYVRKVYCGGSVKLKIDALGLRARVFWDGKLLGECEHAFSPEIFYFKAGKKAHHTLEIAVENTPHTRDAGLMYVDDYDFHCYGGIYDSVSITELDSFYLDRIQLTPKDLKGNVVLKIVAGGKLPAKYKATIYFDHEKYLVKELSGKENEISCKVPDARIWSPSSPELHHCRVILNENEDMVETSFGIRTLKAEKGKIFLNGKAIELIGYNRHDSHPSFGYALPQSLMLMDLSLIKEQGCNFIRGSHYPQRERFLELCDRMGLLVWEEVLGWNNQPSQCADPRFRKLQVEQAESMVRKSANHPSVIMWGFLNEVYMPEGECPRKLIESIVNTIRKEDSSRLVTFAYATGWKECSDNCLDLVDVLSFNTYPGWYGHWHLPGALETILPKFQELVEFASRKELKNKPLIISEMGGAAIYGNHDDYRWGEEYQAELISIALNEILDNPRFSGIAFWQFCDAKTHLICPGILNKPRGFNNKGLLDEYRRPKYAWKRVTEILRERNFDGTRKK